MTRTLLFLNGSLGLNIIQFLCLQSEIEITGVIVNEREKRASTYVPRIIELLPSVQIFEYSQNLWEQSEFRNILNEANLAVSALFGHMIPSKVVKKFRSNIINLHPSLLPLGRGADPIPWAIIENEKQGVSIHIVEDKLDSGRIISQSEISVVNSMTAGEIYELAMDELLTLFKEFIAFWPGQMDSEAQEGKSSYHRACELQTLRDQLSQGDGEIERSVRVIQALTYSDGRAARLRFSNGELWEISLSMYKVEE